MTKLVRIMCNDPPEMTTCHSGLSLKHAYPEKRCTPYCVATRDISRCFRQRNASLGRFLVEICSWRTGDGVWVNASGALTAHMRIQTPETSRSQPETFLKSTRSPPLEGSIQKNLLPQRSAFSERAPTGTHAKDPWNSASLF